MTEVWNFHDFIAMDIERYANKYVYNGFKSASDIANGEFVDAMFEILEEKLGSLDDIRDFVEMSNEYDKVRGDDIPREKAEEIYNEFKRLVNL